MNEPVINNLEECGAPSIRQKERLQCHLPVPQVGGGGHSKDFLPVCTPIIGGTVSTRYW